MIAHIVLFEPKPGISVEHRGQFLKTLRQTMEGVPGIQRARVGRIFSLGLLPESTGGQLTYSYAAVLEFADREALDVYFKHPAHDVLRSQFWELCLRTLIADADIDTISPASTRSEF